MGMNIDITTEQRRTVLSLLSRFLPRSESWVYGSRAKWTSGPKSDLDLVVFAEPDEGHMVSALRTAFEESNLPFRVDLFVWNEVPEQFQEQIEADHVVLVGSNEEEDAKNWRTVGEFSPFTYGKSLPAHSRNPSGKVPVFGSNGVVDYHDVALTDGPTVIIGRKGTVGAIHYSSVPCWPIDTTFFVSGDEPDIQRFRYYALKSLGLEQMNSDSAVPGLNRDDAHARRLNVPPVTEQRAIAHVLGTLDDKIELNQRMNETLEEMARALFKSWFVDFDPVRAKMEDRWQKGESLPGLSADLYDLFPNRLVDSALGEIPEGWEVGTVRDVIEIHDSKRIPLNSRQRTERQGPYPYYGAAGLMDYVDDYLFDGVYVLVGEDGSVVDDEGYPVVQYVWGQFWVNNHAHVLKARSGVSLEHLFLYLKQTNIAPFVTGAVQPKLSQTNLTAIPFLLPSHQVCAAFAKVGGPLFLEMRCRSDESHALAFQRDTLLPRLVSGEITAPSG